MTTQLSTDSSSTLNAFEVKLINFPNEKISFSAPSWVDLYQLTFDLAAKIKASGQNFDRIVTLAKGGWPMTVSLVDLLDLNQVASIGVKFYTGVNERLPQPEVYQALPVEVKGEKVLLFDDVADTGESLKFVTDYLLGAGAASVSTATLLYKPHSKLKPDFFGAQTDTWIIFPYDLVESITNLGVKWQAAGLSVSEIEQRLQEFGFKLSWLKPYTQTLLV